LNRTATSGWIAKGCCPLPVWIFNAQVDGINVDIRHLNFAGSHDFSIAINTPTSAANASAVHAPINDNRCDFTAEFFRFKARDLNGFCIPKDGDFRSFYAQYG
jgi:hypothetical protein